MQTTDYIKPEPVVVVLVLHLMGIWTKQSEAVKDRYILLINGGLGVVTVPYTYPRVHETPFR